RGCSELLVDLRRAQVREQRQLLAQSEDRLLRALGGFQVVVLRVAYRAEQDRIGGLRERQRLLGQRVARGLVARAADRRLGELELQAEAAEHLEGFGNDLLADAVA